MITPTHIAAGALTLAICLILAVTTKVRGETAPPQSIAVIGDSIALGTGIKLCALIDGGALDEYRCHIRAAKGATTRTIIELIESDNSDIVVIAAGTNDPPRTAGETALNLVKIRTSTQRYARVIWIGAAHPRFANPLIAATAQHHGDQVVVPEFGCCSFQKKIHPKDYNQVAFDVMMVILSLPKE